VLDNGLTLIVHEDHKAPIVAINTWYHVGSKNEKLGKTGFAHLFEHLMFGGSDHAKGSYIEAMERIGATDLNGTTNNDRTNYFENVPTSAVDYTLWMESDRMGFLTLDQKTLDLQRGVVQNESGKARTSVRGVAATDYAEYVSGGASVFVDSHRRHGGPECGGDGRCEGMVQDVLRAVERRDCDGGRH